MPYCARCTLALARPVLGLSDGPAQVAAGCRGWIVQVGWSTRGRIRGNYWPARWLLAWSVGRTTAGRWTGQGGWPHGRLRTATAAQMEGTPALPLRRLAPEDEDSQTRAARARVDWLRRTAAQGEKATQSLRRELVVGLRWPCHCCVRSLAPRASTMPGARRGPGSR